MRKAAAGAFLVLGFAASAPASAATSVRTPYGAALTVWQAGSGLGYALLSVTGTSIGQVPSTGASTQDAYPWLDLDPASGAPVLIWSRSDGVSLKIAYARFQGDAWTDMHFLTFGSGDHTLPLLATSRDGSFLFYVADGTRYMYAPLDVTSGRLFAAPRHISTGSFQRGAD